MLNKIAALQILAQIHWNQWQLSVTSEDDISP